jgi:hypothetical protein
MASPPSPLVSWGTTDPPQTETRLRAKTLSVTAGAYRSDVLGKLGIATRAFREVCARKHDTLRRAADDQLKTTLAFVEQRKAERQSWGETADSPDDAIADLHHEARRIEARRDWHANRARGHRDRFERVRACGSGKARAHCEECGAEHDLPVRCDVWRVCLGCRAQSAIERRARFGRGRAAAVRRTSRAGLFSPRRRGGRWSEKHMTLTIPHLHVEGDAATVHHRVSSIFDAWRSFTISLRKHWLVQRVSALLGLGLKRAEARARAKAEQRLAPERYYRFFEWTPGSDLQGHPHFHVWLLCPFLDHAWVARTWGNALRGVGVAFEDDPIVDVREVRTRPNEMARELLKTKEAIKLSRLETSGRGGQVIVEYADGWTIVDVVESGRVPVSLIAALYEALEARRVSQASLGLLAPHELAICGECGEQGAMVIRMLPPVLDEEASGVARGPPIQVDSN